MTKTLSVKIKKMKATSGVNQPGVARVTNLKGVQLLSWPHPTTPTSSQT